MNNIDNDILLLFCHLIIRRQAQPASEDIRPDIRAAPGDVGVRAAAAVALSSDEWMRPVNRLHMHRLPSMSMTHHAAANR